MIYYYVPLSHETHDYARDTIPNNSKFTNKSMKNLRQFPNIKVNLEDQVPNCCLLKSVWCAEKLSIVKCKNEIHFILFIVCTSCPYDLCPRRV